MTTTELIKLLKSIEKGASGKYCVLIYQVNTK